MPLLSTETTENTEPFLCKHAILQLPLNKKIEKYFLDHGLDLDMPFIQFIKKYIIDLRIIQKMAKIKLILIKKNKNRLYSLLFDGRHLHYVQDKWKLKILILNKHGSFLNKYNKLHRVPKLRNTENLKNKQPLWQLLNLTEKVQDPQTRPDAINFLKYYKKENVIIQFLYKPQGYYDYWHQPFGVDNCIMIEAFTLHDYSIGFRKMIIKKAVEKIVIKKEMPAPKPIVPTQQNKSSCVNVRLTGLNEAFNLGLINYEKLTFLSQQLSKTIGTLHLELDNENKAKFATYQDAETFTQIELKDIKSWNKLFNLIFQQKRIFAVKKETILQELLNLLSNFQSKLNNPYKKCLFSLKNCIKNFKLIMYVDSDFPLHALKLHLAHHLNTHQKTFTLNLNSNSMNDITCIKNSEITIFNLYTYLEDKTFFKSYLPPANIQSNILDFKNQKKQDSGLTTLKHCKQRGQDISKQVLLLYQNMAQDFMTLFQYDITSLPYQSLASLSFQVIWNQYTKLGGNYHHGLEKIKPHYENILRQYSQGGYFFSCKSKVDANEPIHNTFGNPASSLLEMDLISSYGAASSHMSTPTGFCYGYILNEDNELIRCDSLLRHTTFEFLSVFYTIDCLETQGYAIKTCFSNFHSTGIFSIGNYPIDLVVICQDGKLLLYQFDGQVSFCFIIN